MTGIFKTSENVIIQQDVPFAKVNFFRKCNYFKIHYLEYFLMNKAIHFSNSAFVKIWRVHFLAREVTPRKDATEDYG